MTRLAPEAQTAAAAQPAGSKLRLVARAFRVHQWAKNVLVFVPVVTAHEISSAQKVTAAWWCFVAFSLCASAVYVLNDLLDVDADRQHPRKRSRPFASGALSAQTGIRLAVLAFASAVVIAVARLSAGSAAILGLYVAVTTAYSLVLKRKAVVDVLTLAGLYTLRVFAGGIAAEVRISEWLLVFSMFLFLSIAFAKRYTELSGLAVGAEGRIRGRGYFGGDLDLVRTIGAESGVLAVLVLALYINLSPEVARHYPTPAALYLICPIVLYWIVRMWLLAQRRQLEDDPLVFALRDRRSLVAGGIAVLLLVAASLDFANLTR